MNAIQHIAFTCRDLKRSEAFYTRHFGFRRARVFNRGRPDEFLMLRLGGVCIELFQAPAGAAPAAPVTGVGYKHLAFEVRDLDAAVARLREDGIAPDPVADCSAIVPGMRVCFFQDPDGNRVELMQGYRDEAAP
jgi:glyoxylase I family protein